MTLTARITSCRSPPGPMPGVEAGAIVAFLSNRDSYAGRPRTVEVLETHYSWLFMMPERVYKLKKRVKGPFFDFTTIELRRRNCETELRLNRRLAPEVYRAVVPLTLDTAGRLALGGAGPVVDWIVEMTRLPARRMLERCLLEGRWTEGEIRGLGGRLAGFFRKAPPVRVPARHARDLLGREIDTALDDFDNAGNPMLLHAAQRLALRLRAFIAANEALFRRRFLEGRFVEGHGDLRPEHVCLGPEPCIIDCLEFSRGLRLLDPVDEIAFLSMECARLGAPQIERILFQSYRRATGDIAPARLVAFYKGFRALVRARISIRHLLDPVVREPGKWPARSADYLAIGLREMRSAR
ncbi:hypothetical protein [Labrys monachus]|uniref:Aminoglycoside phosphotransferase family enzyme n=1 Tax=Labrys monachus TaxID=217067 RepID=A0ABU0F6Q1_9HYPH|nr:hypothetical protein [Labrys monachus]MDQ0390297.1 aminoglycoside phosphotransferase family enzyme [Labrys monachus]